MTRFYVSEKIGPKQSLTPEGFLLCEGVPIARTGIQIYGPGETPVPVGPDGIIKVEREPEEVFRPETIASANGKPVVNDHPESGQFVRPETWKALAVGVALNPRRGTVGGEDVLIADLLISDAAAIEDVRAGKREVSCGYDAEYDEDTSVPGHGWQRDIMINHVALVEAGRCGPLCAIQDHAAPCSGKEQHMARSNGRGALARTADAIRQAFKDKDEAKLEEALKEHAAADAEPDEKKDDELHVHVHGEDRRGTYDEERFTNLENRVASMEDKIGAIHDKVMSKDDDEDDEDKNKKTEDEEILGALKLEAPPGTNDAALKATTDSALLQDSYQETLAMAEILAPGIRVPAFDRALSPKATYDAMCGLRRNTLELAMMSNLTRDAVMTALDGKKPDFTNMTCDAVRNVFRQAASIQKAANNAAARAGSNVAGTQDNGARVRVGALTPAEINRRNTEYWAKQTPRGA